SFLLTDYGLNRLLFLSRLTMLIARTRRGNYEGAQFDGFLCRSCFPFRLCRLSSRQPCGSRSKGVSYRQQRGSFRLFSESGRIGPHLCLRRCAETEHLELCWKERVFHG